MAEILLETDLREIASKSKLAALRAEKKVPAVFYGKNIDSKSISVDLKSFMSIIDKNGLNAVITLNFKDGKQHSIVKYLQRDILTQIPIHIDFKAISLKDVVEVKVPIHLEGVADGVKNFGGLMESIIREVEIECLPTNIPQKISIDVSALGIGDGITISQLPQIEGVKYLQDPSTLIVHIVAMSVEEETPAADATATTEAAQPEVISKGKKDKEEEGEAGANPAAPKK
jgi:large subunit ribosomal protein L25